MHHGCPRFFCTTHFPNWLVRPLGFEPRTPWLKVKCSQAFRNQLSYGRMSFSFLRFCFIGGSDGIRTRNHAPWQGGILTNWTTDPNTDGKCLLKLCQHGGRCRSRTYDFILVRDALWTNWVNRPWWYIPRFRWNNLFKRGVLYDKITRIWWVAHAHHKQSYHSFSTPQM